MEKKVWIGLFIAFVMIFSAFGMVLDSIRPSQKLEYNDFNFKYKDNQFFTRINGVEHGFLYFPGDLEYINVSESMKSLLSAPVVTVTYDPQSVIAEDLGTAQYYFEVQLQGVKVVERALTNNTGTALPQKSCVDATYASPVVELRLSDESSVVLDNKCLILNAVDARDLFHETERIVYSVLGVMS